MGPATSASRIRALIALLTAGAYLANLQAIGWANGYYAAAVRAGTESWTAFFFGSLDPGNVITVDKPPASLWLMALSCRIFGFSAWAMILPQIVLGVACVLLLHRLVQQWKGDVAAHLAALTLALTPIAAAMFRNNNPDALLTFLGLVGAWATWRALATGRTSAVALIGLITGLAFTTKMLQALLLVPAFALTYLIAGPPRLGARIGQLVLAGVGLVASSTAWMLAVSLVPASQRPWVGSSTDNSIWSLVLGYNGLDRILGQGAGAGGPGGAGAIAPGMVGNPTFGGPAGLLRLFNPQNAGLIAWLIPAALTGLAVGLWLCRREPRTSPERAGWLLWGTWAVTTIAVFSTARGIYHPYYTVQLAPALATLAAGGALTLFTAARSSRRWLLLIGLLVVGNSSLAALILARTPDFAPWLPPVIVTLAGLWLVATLWSLRPDAVRPAREAGAARLAAAAAAAVALAGPAAFTAYTIAHPVAGSLVSAGPLALQGPPGPGGPGASYGPGAPYGPGGPGGPGASQPNPELNAYLLQHRGRARFLAAGISSFTTAPIIIGTGQPVVTVGGFGGNDPAPGSQEFIDLVTSGQVRFFVLGDPSDPGAPGGAGGPTGYVSLAGFGPDGVPSASIRTWVLEHGTPVRTSLTGGVQVYDLAPARP